MGIHIIRLYNALYSYKVSHGGAGVLRNHFLLALTSSSKENHTTLLVHPQYCYKLVSNCFLIRYLFYRMYL